MHASRRSPRVAAAAVLALAALAAGAARAERLPMQSDFDRCALEAADRGQTAMLGRVRLDLLIRKSGQVYAAYVHSSGLDDRRLHRCLTSTATRFELPAVPLDYLRAYVLTFSPGGSVYSPGMGNTVRGTTGVFMPDINAPPEPSPLDLALAQSTLELLDSATTAEHGQALLAVGQLAEAVKEFRSALAETPSNALALRGLAQALAESGKDLEEARTLANQLIDFEPESEVGHEAMLRVCLAASDDECALAQFRAARAAKDLQPRSRLLSELQEATQQAVDRLKAHAGGIQKDDCATAQGDEAQALCLARRCLEDGTAAFAQELSAQNAEHYQLSPWTVKAAGRGRFVVTRPISAAVEGATKRHDAIWLVKLGDPIVLEPASTEAHQITLRHNRCGARQRASR